MQVDAGGWGSATDDAVGLENAGEGPSGDTPVAGRSTGRTLQAGRSTWPYNLVEFEGSGGFDHFAASARGQCKRTYSIVSPGFNSRVVFCARTKKRSYADTLAPPARPIAAN